MLAGNAAARKKTAKTAADQWIALQTVEPEAQCSLGIAYHAAFELMRKMGGEDHFHTLAAAVNIAGRFCEIGIGDEYAAEVESAIGALNRVRERALARGRWALDGPGLAQVARALEVHDAQLAVATYGELRAAINEVMRRNDAAHESERLAA